MKILIVNTSDTGGGAARAAYRLHQALLAREIDSQMLVQHKGSDDFTVLSPTSKIKKGINLLRFTLDVFPVSFYKNRTKTLFSPAWLPFSGIVDKINEINPDIVHLHWICGGMIKIEDLAKIKAPIVWSLHDNWAFTGGCHIMWECEKYKENCGAFLMTIPFVWDEHEQPYDYARYSSFGLKHILAENGFEIIEHRKSNNGIEVVFQLINAYTYKTISTRSKYLNLLIILLLTTPVNILGFVLSKIMPRNDDLYLDNIVLTRKTKDV